MSIKDFFTISLNQAPCIEGLSEDTVRELINALEIEVKDDKFGGFVLSSNGTQVKFQFDPNGNFTGVTAKVNSKNIPIIPGFGSKELYIFKGPPTNTNPGAGFQTEPDLTVRYLSQPSNENQWEIFYASRAAIINP